MVKVEAVPFYRFRFFYRLLIFGSRLALIYKIQIKQHYIYYVIHSLSMVKLMHILYQLHLSHNKLLGYIFEQFVLFLDASNLLMNL